MEARESPLPRERIILRTDALRAVEAQARALPLMERAGSAAAEVAVEMLAGRAGRVLVLAGPGNNGGDGFVAARLLRRAFHDVTVAFAGEIERLPPDARAAAQAWREAGGSCVGNWPGRNRWGLIVDAVFGIGLTRPPGGAYAEWIRRANADPAPVLALDIPSGLDGESGRALDPTIRAARTATFIAQKVGLLTGDGPDCAGIVSVHDLGMDVGAMDVRHGTAVGWPDAGAVVRRRTRNSHKGSYGTVGILGGAPGMVGAAVLAARAALLLGAGKVLVGFPGAAHPEVDWLHPELMLRTAEQVLALAPDVLVVGPGLGDADAMPWLEPALDAPVPLVADADLLNRVAGDVRLREALRARTAPTLITPHPAEAARLLGVSTAAIQHDRVGAAMALAHDLHAEVVLKGCGSVCASPDGGWSINTTGNPGLASGGTGDTLAGLLGALLAQHVEAASALRAAVALHGAAADALVDAGVGPAGLTASELPATARRLLNAAAT